MAGVGAHAQRPSSSDWCWRRSSRLCFLGSQLGGVVADRYRKRNVLLVTQSLFTLPSFALFAVNATGHAQYWMILLAAFATGTINLFDVPARQSPVIEMVGKQGLMNAIALNSSVFNTAAVVGPAVAGVIIGIAGVPICFLANSVSYLAGRSWLCCSCATCPSLARERHEQHWLRRIAEGASYARRGAGGRNPARRSRRLLAFRDEPPDPGSHCLPTRSCMSARRALASCSASMGLGAS